MKRIIILIISMVWGLTMSSQTIGSKPTWLKHLPKAPRRAMYYYRVTSAEAKTYEEAYSKAFAIAVYESRWKLGVAVDLNMGVDEHEKEIRNSISIEPSQIRIPLNKVCEFQENSPVNMNIRVHILWQIAKYGNVDPDFDDFTNCE